MCRAARASEQVGKAKFFGGKFVARKTAEVTAANAEAMRASFRGAAKDAEESAARISANAAGQANRVSANAARDANRVSANAARDANSSVDYAGRTFRRSAIVGSVALGGGLSIPVVVNHAMAGKREKKRSKMRKDAAENTYRPDKRERKVVQRKVLKDPVHWGAVAANLAGTGVMGYGGYKYLTQKGPVLRRKYPPNMQILQPDKAGIFRPVPFKNGVKGLTGRGKMAALVGGGLLAREIANWGGANRDYRVANRAREEAGYPQRTFWTGQQKTESRIEKGWKGEPGDKRNSKYALAMLSGSVVPGLGNVVVPVGYGMYRNMDEDGRRRREISIANSKKMREMKRKEVVKSVRLSQGNFIRLRHYKNRDYVSPDGVVTPAIVAVHRGTKIGDVSGEKYYSQFKDQLKPRQLHSAMRAREAQVSRDARLLSHNSRSNPLPPLPNKNPLPPLPNKNAERLRRERNRLLKIGAASFAGAGGLAAYFVADEAVRRKEREKRKIIKALSPQTRSVMSKQNYLLGSGVTLVDLSKAMSPNKLHRTVLK